LFRNNALVAELTGKNTNVFYEVGLAHTLGKPVIIVTRNEDDVPFDLKALRYRYYNTEDPFWGENLKQAIKDMIVELLKETRYGYVFEGIRLEGDTKYVRPEAGIRGPEIAAHNLTGIWQGTMKIGEREYNCNMHLVQRDQELSGTLNVSYVVKQEQKEQLTVVQEMMVGAVRDHTLNVHAISYSFVQQGLTAAYSLDAFVGEVSADGDKISGDARDKAGKAGSFLFEKVKAEQEC
jgi:hypothetical protein